MIALKKIFIISSFFIISLCSFGDSPITSTEFYKAYSNYEILNDSYYKDGLLTKKIMEYLDDENPIDIKMAIINKLGWDVNGKKNTEIYFDYLYSKHGYKDENDFIRRSTSDNLLCIAYLKAMDNYFNVGNAIWYAKKALEFNPKSFTYNMISAIIEAQNKHGVEIYDSTNSLRKKDLKLDMKAEALEYIYEYMDLYKDENDIDSKGWTKDEETGVFWNNYTGDSYDKEGYNYEGYDIEGYDREGFNKNGADRDGFNTKGVPRIKNWFAIERLDDFDEPTGRFSILQKILSNNIRTFVITKDEGKYIIFIMFEDEVFNLYQDVKVSIKDSSNKLTTITGVSLGEGITFLNQSEILKFIDLLKKQTSVKVSIIVSGDKYIFDIDCKGFIEISKKYLK